jgi:predicted nicotinamide N-methyase
VTEAIVVGEVRLELERPVDPEALIDEDVFADDEYLPYWAERWPSGVALAHHVAALDLRGARVLELGCGLGLPSLVAAAFGADVVATDWSADAIALLERNADRNGVRLGAVRADWREPEPLVSLGPFDHVLAADVLYEERNVDPILALLALLAAPVTLADPGRRHAPGFLDRARGDGWAVATDPDAQIPHGGIHRLSSATRS